MTPGPFRRIGQNILLSVASAVASSWALLEGGARVLERRNPPKKVADYLWDWEQRWDGDFYTVGSDAVGWPPWQEFNADGLRDRARPVEKLPGTRRVVALGDSVTLGAGIEAAEAWPQRLEAGYAGEGRPVEVLNVALWGWSTRQERIAYTRLARAHHPDQVLLAVCLNDIPELQNNLSRPPQWLRGLFERSALVRRVVDAEGREIRDVEELFRRPDSAPVREAFGRFFAEVRELRREVQADGATLGLIVFPFRLQVVADAPAPTAQETIRSFCEGEGLRCLDLLPTLRPRGGLGLRRLRPPERPGGSSHGRRRSRERAHSLDGAVARTPFARRFARGPASRRGPADPRGRGTSPREPGQVGGASRRRPLRGSRRFEPERSLGGGRRRCGRSSRPGRSPSRASWRRSEAATPTSAASRPGPWATWAPPRVTPFRR